MKKIFFYILILICLYLLYNIFNILLYDIDRLTQYGYGYIVGQIAILSIVAFSAFRMYKKA